MKPIKIICFFLLGGLLSISIPGFSQQLSRQKIISAYIYNFATHITWPHEKEFSRFNLKILSSDKKLINEFKLMTKKKKIKGKPIIVTSETKFTDAKNEQLIFVDKNYKHKLDQIFDRIKEQNILLISENYDEKLIVMINFFTTKNNEIKFEINKANIINQGLTVSPEMVLLGGSELDIAKIYRQSQLRLSDLQKQLGELSSDRVRLQKKIEKDNLKYLQQCELITSQNKSIQVQKSAFSIQKQRLQSIINRMELRKQALHNKVAIANCEIEQQKKMIESQVGLISKQKTALELQKKKSDTLRQEIDTGFSTLTHV